jgi:hypothetical protein
VRESFIVRKILKRYELLFPLSRREKARVGKAKKRTLVRIVGEGGMERFKLLWSISCYNFLRNLGMRVTPAGGARAAFASAVVMIMIIAGGSVLLVIKGPDMRVRISEGSYAKNATVRDITGSVIAKKDGKERTIANGTTVAADESIVTGSGSFCTLTADSGAVFTLLHDSDATPKIHDKDISIDLRKGCVMSKVPSPYGGIYEVRTPDSLVRVKGTVFAVTYDGTSTTVMVLSGVVEVTHTLPNTPNAPGTKVDCKEGFSVTVGADMKARAISNREKAMLEGFSAMTIGVQKLETIKAGTLNSLYDKLKSAEPALRTFDDLKLKYGQIDEIEMFNGRRIAGAIIARGPVLKIMTVHGVITVPAKDIRNIRVR